VPYFFNFCESSRASIRKLLKALRNPRDAAAVINAQLHLGGKAKLPLSVRLTGGIILTGEGQVKLGNGVSFVGTVVPIEIASSKGARISIGDHTFVNYGALISACKDIEIGHHCFLGHYTFLLGNKEYGVEQDDVSSSPSIMIGDHAWIGSHVTVLPGVTIGHHAAVGAGSVVTKSIPPYCLAVGNPARVVRELSGVLHDSDVRVVQRSMEPT
jgi:acetyltransferase-like isoleucine patch superfamily enzyme